jgi:hypothetical protein
MANLSDKQYTELQKIFFNIKINSNDKKVALELIKKENKNRKEMYNQMSFVKNSLDLPDSEITELINTGLLGYLSEKEKTLTLTFKALVILDYELRDVNSNLSNLLDDMNKEFFEKVIKLSKEKLESKEKAIILGLLGINSISDKYAIRINDSNKRYFKEAIEIASNFLVELGCDYNDGSLEKLWSFKVIGEDPVLSEMRRTNKLPLKTDNLYKPNEGKPYIDILTKDNKTDEDKVVYLLKTLFNFKPLLFEEKKNLLETLNKIQGLEFKIFKNEPPFDSLKIRNDLKIIIEKT